MTSTSLLLPLKERKKERKQGGNVVLLPSTGQRGNERGETGQSGASLLMDEEEVDTARMEKRECDDTLPGVYESACVSQTVAHQHNRHPPALPW